MAIDNSQSHGIDLDRTDRLPILEGMEIAEDVADDSVRLDYPAFGSHSGTASPAPAASHPPDFARPGVDLPSLAESVRSVEERIARQNADYEALNRLYEKARDAQLAAGTRADALASELAAVQSTLAVEQHRSREMQRPWRRAGRLRDQPRSGGRIFQGGRALPERGAHAARGAHLFFSFAAIARRSEPKGPSPQVATALQEMSATVLQVSEHSNKAAEAARHASETAHHGGSIVEETLTKMRVIAESVGGTARKMVELGKSSDQIGRIIGVIDDIADQTNLLALKPPSKLHAQVSRDAASPWWRTKSANLPSAPPPPPKKSRA